MRIRLLLTAFALLALTVVSCNVTPQLGSSPTEKVISAMSLEDKAAMVVILESDARTHSVPEMGIPSVVFADCDSDFPLCGQALSQTWNAALAEEYGRSVAVAVRQNGADCLFPKWKGISACDFSDNAILSGRMAKAFMEGISSFSTGTVLDYDCAGSRYAVGFSTPWAVAVSCDSTKEHIAEIRGEWNFNGVAIAREWAGSRASDLIGSGYDMVLADSGSPVNEIVNAVTGGLLDEDLLDAAVARVLGLVTLVMESRDIPADEMPAVSPDLARDIAAQSVVLIKNSRALPVAKGARHIALYGPSAYSANLDGTLLAYGFKLDVSVTSSYARLRPQQSFTRQPYLLRADAIENETALVVISRGAGGEGVLSEAETNMITDVCNAFHSKNRKVTVLLATRVPVHTEDWESAPDAILQVPSLTPESEQAVVEVLCGAVCPSGRIASAWPSYPFAHGLSYADFSYSDESCVSSAGYATMSVRLTNTGSTAGMHPVLFYDGTLDPANLAGFSKSRLLQPGESQIMELTVADSISQSVVGPVFFR